MKVKAGILPQIKMLLMGQTDKRGILVVEGIIDKDFPYERSIEIARFVSNQLEKEIKLVDDKRIMLCKKMAKKDDKGNFIMTVVNDQQSYEMEDYPKFQVEFTKLMDVEIELNFNIFEESELKKFNFHPRFLISLEGVGLLKGYKAQEQEPTTEREIKLGQ
jgi:hypothetical protein